MKIRENYETFKDILQQKKNIPQFAKETGTTKQNINFKVKTFVTEVAESSEYKNMFSFTEGSNKIVRFDHIVTDEILKDVFCFINKKNIFNLNKKLFYSTIDVNTVNNLVKETITDLRKVDIAKALKANNITADEEFIEDYGKDTHITDFKIRPLSIVEDILKENNGPMSKEELIQKVTSLGVKEKTVINIIRNVSNNEDKVIILGDTVCDRDVFFDNYIDAQIAHKFVTAAVAVCEKNKVCATDIKWIKTNVETTYPDIDISQYSHYELKAILCNEAQLFDKGVKFNLTYLGNKCQFTPSNVTELVEKVLEEYQLPISLKFILNKLEEHGKSFSITTLSSHILPLNDNFEKIRNAGWVLTKNADYAKNLLKDIETLGIENIINQLKKEFKVVTLKDLATKMNMSLSSVLDAYYKTSTLETFITKLNEAGYKISIKNGNFKASR